MRALALGLTALAAIAVALAMRGAISLPAGANRVTPSPNPQLAPGQVGPDMPVYARAAPARRPGKVGEPGAGDRSLRAVRGEPFAAPPVAVVELFTSEGCSSCPPADDLLREIAEKARRDDRRVYALAFHVDYWNHLGWRDVFSDAAFSKRQRSYARALGSPQVYTPQMIVNGAVEFVGSFRNRALAEIEKALDRPASARIEIESIRRGPSSLVVKYSLSGATRRDVVHAAMIERDIVRRIGSGENSGRSLRHDEVVRVFGSVRTSTDSVGSIELALPRDLDSRRAGLVVYVQNSRTMAVLGADGADLARAAAAPPSESRERAASRR